MVAGGAAEVRQVVGASGRRRALEGERFEAWPTLLGAPLRVEVVQLGGHVVRVAVTRAEDDGLLLGAAGGEKVLE